MYTNYYGLTTEPFAVTPNTEFYIDTANHRECLNLLQAAIYAGESFVKITGEVGTGKTLLCRKFISLLQKNTRFIPLCISNPYLTPLGLRWALADQLQLNLSRKSSPHQVLEAITQRLIVLNTQYKSVVLLIDEAQSIPEDTLEALRLLTNLETDKVRLFQIILFGQPELDAKLNKKHLRQLKQRIIFSYQLDALDKENIKPYVEQRLQIAGYQGQTLFSEAVLKYLYQVTQGIPRLINILSHKALLLAYASGDKNIKRNHLYKAAIDTESVTAVKANAHWQYWFYPVSLATGLVCAMGCYLLLGY